MPTNPTHGRAPGEQVNRLYWTSNQTVDEITDRLGISRNSVYSSIRPTPAGHNCTECGERLVFTNRTNRAAGTATCTHCSTEQAVGSDRQPTAAREHDETHGRGTQTAVQPERVLLIGGAAALGVVAGAVSVQWFHGRNG
jgi:hypothetical protein